MKNLLNHLIFNRKTLPVAFLFFLNLPSYAQILTQTLRGTVYDKISQQTLPGASVILVGTNPLIGASADDGGNFRITQVPIGRYTMKVTFLGYSDVFVPNILVSSGKEVVLSLHMEENVVEGKEIVVEEKIEKEKPLNEMATVSARTFSVEETQKYAAAVNDPARAAASLPGVVSTDDGNNEISVRGNNPNGLLWRLEGIDIPNPNHFSDAGSSGGGISILSAQLMANSDFLTCAFPAEYGNALSSVFDMKLRKGNNEKREYTLQAGFLGLDFAAEGPFSDRYRGSYLINYRYSTLSVLSKLNVNVGDAVTNFQDLSYNIYLPTKKAGLFSVFGFSGWSDQNFDAVKDSTQWENDGERWSWNYQANTAVSGLKHAITLGSRSYLTNTLSYSITDNQENVSRYMEEYENRLMYKENAVQKKLMLTSVLNHKIDTKNSLRTGFSISNTRFDFEKREYNFDLEMLELKINSADHAAMLQTFAQWKYRINYRFTLNTGLHFSDFILNNSLAVEPRAAIAYNVKESQSITVGYGLVSQTQPLGVYFASDTTLNLSVHTNEKLGLSKAHHVVVGYDIMFDEHHHFKAETYFQSLYQIPVGIDSGSTFSIINHSDGFVTEQLMNEGQGRNYGLEITFERFLHKQFYYLFTASLFDSKYMSCDGIWRNTKYNSHYATTFTGGKDFKIGKKEKNLTLGINLKVIYRGGYYQTPVDLDKSIANGYTAYKEELAYSQKLPDYFRTDIKFSLRRNKPKSTQTLSLDIQNATNRKNIYGDYYNADSKQIETYYQAPLIPILSYKVEF